MLAAIHNTFGEPAAVLNSEETAKPTPAKGEVLVRMVLSPIHNHDLWTIRGAYGYKPDLPGAIGGSEAIGIIEELGDGVDAAMLGLRVAIAGVHGTWAEYFTAPATGIMPLPEAMSDVAGAQIIAMPFSAISLLETLKVKKGEWMIQTASNGAVGKIMAVLAKSRGINIVNLVRRVEAVTELQAMGLENVISTSEANWQDAVRTAIGDNRAVSAIDSVGGETGAALIDLLGVDGELVVFGTTTDGPLPLSSGTLIFKHITVKGFWGSRVSADMPAEERKRLITELVTMTIKGELVLTEGGIFPLSDVSGAMNAALTPGREGKVMFGPKA